MRRSIIAAALGLGLITCTAAAALAEVPTCDAELKKFCKDVKPGQGRIINCLRTNEKSLSDACRAYVNTASQYMACMDDVARLCPGMEPAGAVVLQCLRANETDLSMECKSELQKLQRW